jgi:hypothetical protein
MRDILINAYLDYVDNYLTIEKYAEHNGLTVEQAKRLIGLGRDIHITPHPDA